MKKLLITAILLVCTAVCFAQLNIGKGFENAIDAGYSHGVSKSHGLNSIRAHYVTGYRTGLYFWGVGSGVRFSMLDGLSSLNLPLFGQVKINFGSDEPTDMFFLCNLGYNINLDSFKPAGLYVSPAYGMDFKRGFNKSIFVTLAYEYESSTFLMPSGAHSLSITLGIKF